MVEREPRYILIVQFVFLFVLFSSEAFAQDITGLDAEYCINSPVDTIYGINPTTGTFAAFDGGRATGVTQISWNPAIAIFDPSAADLHGDHAHVVYEGVTFRPDVDENIPNASLDPLPAFFCNDDPAHFLNEGSPASGFYLLDGVDVITEFDPGLYGPG